MIIKYSINEVKKVKSFLEAKEKLRKSIIIRYK